MLEFLYATIWSSIIVLVIALAILIKSADYFTDISEKIGVVLGIPQFIVGVTIVSIGTSIPELATSIAAVFSKATEFVVANAIGSNITNIFLVVGVSTLLVKKMVISEEILRIDVPLLVGSAILITFLLWDGIFTLLEALFVVIIYGIYILYISKEHLNRQKLKDRFEFRWVLILLLAVVGIYFGASFSVDSVKSLTVLLGLPDTSMIAITAIALGTSLPELMVSVVAALKKNFDISIGNIIGSNIFNSFMVIGIPGLFVGLKVSSSTIYTGLPLMMTATLFISFAALKRRISKLEGIVYLLFYAFFVFRIWF